MRITRSMQKHVRLEIGSLELDEFMFRQFLTIFLPILQNQVNETAPFELYQLMHDA